MLVAGCLLGAGGAYLLLASPDRTAPSVLAVEPVQGAYLPAGPATFRLTFSEPLATHPVASLVGPTTVPVAETRFDNHLWEGYAVIPAGSDGGYVLQVAGARDRSGNALGPFLVPYEVDSTPPTSSVRVPVDTTSAPFDASWEAADGNGSGVASVELWIRVNGAGWTMLTSSPNAEDTYRVDPGSQDAEVGLYALAVDRAGNRQDAPSNPAVTVSFSVARATLDPVSAYWFREPTEFTANAGAEVVSAELLYRFSPDNSTWLGPFSSGNATVPCAWSFEFPHGPGHYVLSAQARDLEGRLEPPGTGAELAVGFDEDLPVSSLAPIQEYWHAEPTSVTANASDATSGVLAVELWYAHRGRSTTNWSAWTLEAALTAPGTVVFGFPAGEGHYALRARARDRAGNEGGLGTPDGADTFAGFNVAPPPMPHLKTPDDLTGLFTLIDWTIDEIPDLNRFELHVGSTPTFVPEKGPCATSTTCQREYGADQRTGLFWLGGRDTVRYYRLRAVDEGGLANLSMAFGAAYWGSAYDTPDSASGAGDLPVHFAWAESITDDDAGTDIADWFRVTFSFFGVLQVSLAVPSVLDLSLTVLDDGLNVLGRSDSGSCGSWESLFVIVGAGTYYIVVDVNDAGPGSATDWYTLSL